MLTLTLPIGVAVSLFLLEVTGLSAGGIITSGYVALVLMDPLALTLLGAVAIATWLIISLLSRVLFLYGSRQFAVTVLLGVALSAGVQYAELGRGPATLDGGGLGLVVPGLIAHQFARQGLVLTLLLIAIAAPLVRVFALLILQL